MVTVNGNKASVTVPDKITCSLSGSSVPIVVTSTAVPFTDVKISLIKSIGDDEAKTDKSVGLTPTSGQVVTLAIGSETGVLGFACAAKVSGSELKYKIDGTDKAQFSLSNAVVSVTAQAAGTKPSDVKFNLAMKADSSKAASTVVEGGCPGMGASWMSLAPRVMLTTPLTSAKDVRAAQQKFKAGAEGNHKKQQWCYAAVAAKDAKTTCTFSTMSKGEYHATMYCETIEGWFFASKNVNVTAKDNGGKPVGLTVTYGKAIDVVKDNKVVLDVCGGVAEALATPYSRVTDSFGGYFGKPSPSLGKAPAAKAAATTDAKTTTTAAKTDATKTDATKTDATKTTDATAKSTTRIL